MKYVNIVANSAILVSDILGNRLSNMNLDEKDMNKPKVQTSLADYLLVYATPSRWLHEVLRLYLADRRPETTLWLCKTRRLLSTLSL